MIAMQFMCKSRIEFSQNKTKTWNLTLFQFMAGWLVHLYIFIFYIEMYWI